MNSDQIGLHLMQLNWFQMNEFPIVVLTRSSIMVSVVFAVEVMETICSA